MDPLRFLEVARRLKGSAEEADRRTAVGRAYYALFNLIKESLSEAGVVFRSSADEHGRLVRYLEEGDSRFKPIGRDLKSLRDVRNDADYDMQKNVDPKISEFVFQKAEKAIKQFQGLDSAAVKQLAERIKAKS